MHISYPTLVVIFQRATPSSEKMGDTRKDQGAANALKRLTVAKTTDAGKRPGYCFPQASKNTIGDRR